MGTATTAQRVVLGEGWSSRRALFADTHHSCLGSGRALPYSADRGKKSVSRQALDELKQQIPLLDYLQAQDWRPARQLSRARWMGLCPLHSDRKPSFLVDPSKNLFYCYGCGRGGDVIRFAELYHQVKFPQALALLQQWRGLAPLLHEAAGFYRLQLHRHGEAIAYMHRIVFPLQGNLYGRSISTSAPPHRLLPGAKGGLYEWVRVRRYPEVI